MGQKVTQPESSTTPGPGWQMRELVGKAAEKQRCEGGKRLSLQQRPYPLQELMENLPPRSHFY